MTKHSATSQSEGEAGHYGMPAGDDLDRPSWLLVLVLLPFVAWCAVRDGLRRLVSR